LLDRVGSEGRVVGLDLSPEMIAGARSRLGRHRAENVVLREGDAARTGLGDAEFDAVLCVLGLSVVPDPHGVTQEARRLLKPGGRFVVLDGGAYRGAWRVLNPAIRPLLRHGAGADADRDLPEILRTEFSDVEMRRSQGGSIVLAVAFRS
jgi:SAM-dependent methyltransferase